MRHYGDGSISGPTACKVTQQLQLSEKTAPASTTTRSRISEPGGREIDALTTDPSCKAEHGGACLLRRIAFGTACQGCELAFCSRWEAAEGGLLSLVGNDAHQQVAAEPARGHGADQRLPTLPQLSRGSLRQTPQLLHKLTAINAPWPGGLIRRPAHCDTASARWYALRSAVSRRLTAKPR